MSETNRTTDPRAFEAVSTRTKSAYRPEIDGLRALAVGAVIVHHISRSALPGGYLGVDVFFGISGYVVMSSILRDREQHPRGFLVGFYMRRIKRIAPALLFCVLGTVAAGFVLVPNLGSSLKAGMASLVGGGNLYLFVSEAEYGGLNADYNLFTQTWSLGVEEQFYLILPGLYVISSLLRSGTTFGQRGEISLDRRLLVILGVASFVSLLAYAWTLPTNPSAVFYLPWFRFWELFIACMWAVIAHHRPAPLFSVGVRTVLSTVSLSLVIGTFFVPEKLAFMGMPTVTALFGTIIFIAFTSARQPFHQVLLLSPLRYIGKISYSLYLWHWSVFVLLRWTIGSTPASIAVALVVIFLISAFSYHAVERPLRHAEWSPTRRRSLAFGGLATGAAVAMVAGAAVLDTRLSLALYQGDPRYIVGSPGNDARRLLPACSSGRPVQQEANCRVLVLTIDGDRRPFPQAAESQTELIFVGDSHVAQLIYPLTEIAAMEGAAVPFIQYRPGSSNEAQAIELLRQQLRPGAIVVFTISADRVYTDNVGIFSYSSEYPADDVLLERLDSFVNDLSDVVHRKRARLILVNPAPKICSRQNYARAGMIRGSCTNSRDAAIAHGSHISSIFSTATKRNTSTSHVDIFSRLCDDARCELEDGAGRLLFGDSSPHVTKYVQDQIIESGTDIIRTP